MKLIFLLLALLAFASPAHSAGTTGGGCGVTGDTYINSGLGPATDVRGNACVNFTPTSTVSTSVSSAATLTLTPATGEFVYVTAVHITDCAGASAVTAAAVTSVTTTHLNGAAWTLGSGTTAGACQPEQFIELSASPIKSDTVNTAATVVLPTFATNQTIRVSVYWFSAP